MFKTTFCYKQKNRIKILLIALITVHSSIIGQRLSTSNIISPNKCSLKLTYISSYEIINKIADSTEARANIKIKNLLFGEVGGNGLTFSINYERFLTKVISVRIGYGILFIPVSSWFNCLPMMINYNFSKPVEIGIGIVPYAATSSTNNGGYFGEKKQGILITTTIGFKRIKKGIVARFSFTPFYNIRDNKFKLYGGISFGIVL